jgi:hypothetical protein
MADQDQSLDQSLQAIQNAGMPKGLPTMSPEALESVRKFAEQPGLKKYVALISNPEFTNDLTNVMRHPGLKDCFYWELGWIVVMMVIRSWRMSKTTHLLKTLWITLWTFALFWIVAAVVIPAYFLNPDFMKLVRDTIRLLS